MSRAGFVVLDFDLTFQFLFEGGESSVFDMLGNGFKVSAAPNSVATCSDGVFSNPGDISPFSCVCSRGFILLGDDVCVLRWGNWRVFSLL